MNAKRRTEGLRARRGEDATGAEEDDDDDERFGSDACGERCERVVTYRRSVGSVFSPHSLFQSVPSMAGAPALARSSSSMPVRS